MFLDHTQQRTTVVRAPLDWWSARRRDLYLTTQQSQQTDFHTTPLYEWSARRTDLYQTTHNIHNRQTSMAPVGFKPTISVGEWPKICALDRATTATGILVPPPPERCGAATQRGPWPPHSWGFLITHNDASQSVGLLWTSDRPVAETSTWQHATLNIDRHPCPWWGSNPQSQQASGHRPTS